jgi:hypothetical protein
LQRTALLGRSYALLNKKLFEEMKSVDGTEYVIQLVIFFVTILPMLQLRVG